MSVHSIGHIPDGKRVEQERRCFQAALDEYLSALDRASSSALPEKRRTLLAAYAEFRYQTGGGTHCTTCRAPVRHAMTVEVQRANGETANFAALCTRCLEAEKAQAQRVTLRVGPVEYETITPTAADERETPPVRRDWAA
ncbi:MAG: hypothetical protein M3P27_00305 [Acidobacteriota bacterium]|nr:hypothetical protein [Acidobacteriota bacterium]